MTRQSRAGRRTRPATTGQLLLHPRYGDRHILVEHLATGAETARPLHCGIHRGRAEFHRQDRVENSLIETRTEIVVSPEMTSSCAASGSSIGPASAARGSHELRRSRPGGAGGRRAAPRVQQAVRADRDRAREASRVVHAPARAHAEQSGWLFHLMAVTAPRPARCPSKPIVRDSSAAGGRSPTRAHSLNLASSPAARARYWTRRSHPSGDHPRADATATIDLLTGAAARARRWST